jgi:hypothetical protein
MKTIFLLFVFSFVSVLLRAQSSVTVGTGANIDLGSGTDLSADSRSGSFSGTGTFNNSALPVEMSSFEIELKENSAVLKWETVTEVDNAGFEIQRRLVNSRLAIGNSQFTQVGFVSGSGTSTSPKQYSFVDKDVSPGRYSYRLRQIDRNGTFKYSREVQIEVGEAPKSFSLSQNYPNPFNPSTTIEFTVPSDGRVVLKVYDITGRDLVTLVDRELKAGVIQQAVFDASKLASGIYFVRLQFGSKELLKKMLLVK